MNIKQTFLVCTLILALGVFCRLGNDGPKATDPYLGIVGTQDSTTQLSRCSAEISSSANKRKAINDEVLADLLRESKRKTTFVHATTEEVSRFERLLTQTLKPNGDLHELRQQWAEDGWQLKAWKFNDQPFLAIYEQDHDRRGRGFYVWRIKSDSVLVLQAPHRFYDTGSGKIVSQIFQEHDCRAAAWNTVHRKNYDFAHRRNNHMNAFTRAMIKANSETLIVQLHGFANEKQSGSARTAEMIISDATEYPGRFARETAIRFKQNLGAQQVKLYPLDVRRLGGTKNEQARTVHSMGSLGFLHLELNKDFRERLKISPEIRGEFFSSLAVSSAVFCDSNCR